MLVMRITDSKSCPLASNDIAESGDEQSEAFEMVSDVTEDDDAGVAPR